MHRSTRYPAPARAGRGDCQYRNPGRSQCLSNHPKGQAHHLWRV